jgi:hypothetical protein
MDDCAEIRGMKPPEAEVIMATMALPINMVGTVIVETEKAQTATRIIVSVARSTATVRATMSIVHKTFLLRGRYAQLVKDQAELLERLTTCDFSQSAPEQMLELAQRIGSLVDQERELISDAQTLEVPIRVWWESSLEKMVAQVEHFDSIAESLSAAADPAVTAMMAMTAAYVSASCETVTH